VIKLISERVLQSIFTPLTDTGAMPAASRTSADVPMAATDIFHSVPQVHLFLICLSTNSASIRLLLPLRISRGSIDAENRIVRACRGQQGSLQATETKKETIVQWDEFASAEMTDLTGKLADVPKSQRGIIQQ
jgi:hypothetical protein